MRGKVIAGSIIGAVSVHAALVACSMGGSMSSMLRTLGDGAADALSLESSDAHADDGSASMCSCPVPPAPPDASFTLRVDRGSGVEEPLGDYSAVTVTAGAIRGRDGSKVIRLDGRATFFMPDGRGLMVSCYLQAKPDRTIVADTATCSSGLLSSVAVTGASVTALSDTAAEFTIPSFSAQDGQSTTRFSNITFRIVDPSAHFLATPRAYRTSF